MVRFLIPQAYLFNTPLRADRLKNKNSLCFDLDIIGSFYKGPDHRCILDGAPKNTKPTAI